MNKIKSTIPFAWLLWAILSIPASGQSPFVIPALPDAPIARVASESHHAAVVRVTSDAWVRGGHPSGSGTLIWNNGSEGYVLTANHVTQGAQSGVITYHGGQQSKFRVVGADALGDLALLKTDPPDDAICIPLGEEADAPLKGEVVELVGYGGGRFLAWGGEVNGYARCGHTGPYQELTLNTQTISGDSGGAMIYNGKLVGVIWGGPTLYERGPMKATHGASCVRIRQIFRNILPAGFT